MQNANLSIPIIIMGPYTHAHPLPFIIAMLDIDLQSSASVRPHKNQSALTWTSAKEMVHHFAAPKNILYFVGGVWEDTCYKIWGKT